MEGRVKISGYAGFVPAVGVNNIVGENWENAQLTASSTDAGIVKASATVDSTAMLTSHCTQPLAENESEAKGNIPGYAGYIPKVCIATMKLLSRHG